MSQFNTVRSAKAASDLDARLRGHKLLEKGSAFVDRPEGGWRRPIPLAVAGEFDCQAYNTDAGEDRLSWSIMVDAVLSARAKHKPKAEQRPDREVADGPWART